MRNMIHQDTAGTRSRAGTCRCQPKTRHRDTDVILQAQHANAMSLQRHTATDGMRGASKPLQFSSQRQPCATESATVCSSIQQLGCSFASSLAIKNASRLAMHSYVQCQWSLFLLCLRQGTDVSSEPLWHSATIAVATYGVLVRKAAPN
jgi:hypothetical protein